MDKYSQISSHLRNGKQLQLLDGNLKVSSIVDTSKSTTPSRANNFSGNGLHSSLEPFSRPVGHSVINDLIPYPSSAISTTIERVNGASIYPETASMAHSPVGKNSTPADGAKKKSKCFDNKKTTNWKSHQPASSPNHSVSSTMDIITRRAPSQQAPPCDSDDIVRIVKLLQEKKENSMQTAPNETCNQYVQVSGEPAGEDDSTSGSRNNDNNSSHIDLNRSNQTLKSQVDQLSYIVEEMSKERSATNLQLHSLQKLIKVKELKIEELQAEKEKCVADKDELRFAMKNIETLIGDYQKSLLAKSAESDALRKGLDEGTAERNSLQAQLEQCKGDLRAKEELIAELYRVNGLNQEEMSALRAHYQVLAEQLTRTGAEVQSLLAHKAMLEQHLASGQAGNCALNAVTVRSLQENCTQLRNTLRGMKETFLGEYEQHVQVWNARKGDILRCLQIATHNQVTGPSNSSDATIKSYETIIEHLKAVNERILRDAARHSEEVNAAKEQLVGKMNSLQVENAVLKDTDQTYREKIEALTEQCRKLNAQLNSKAPVGEQGCQTNESGAEWQQIATSLRQLQQALLERDAVIRSQNDQLLKLNVQFEMYDRERTQLQQQLEAHMKQQSTERQAVGDLKVELVEEKDRCKNLSESLLSERQINSKLRKEISRMKQVDSAQLASLDLTQLRLLMKENLLRLKALSSEIDRRKVENEPETTNPETSHSSDIASSSSVVSMKETLESLAAADNLPKDFIIEILKEPSDDAISSCSATESKLHSSIEDIQRELFNIKQALAVDQ